MPNEIYHRSEWGNPKAEGFGDVYFDASATNKLYNHSDNYENSDGTDKILGDIPNKASIVLTPTAYSDGSLNTVIPPYQVLPQELVTNGTFDTDSDWIKGTGWSIANGKASRTSQSGSTACDQNISITANKTYKIVYDLTITSGSFFVRLAGTTNVSGTSRTTSGTYTDYLTAATGNDKIRLVGENGSFVGSIDNVSVKEIQEADFDFSRGSSATRVNEKGLIEDVQILSGELVQNGDFEEIGSELVTNGDFDTDSDWNLQSSASISQNKLIVSNAAQNTTIATQLNVAPTQKPCKLQFDIVVNTGSFRILLGSSGTTTTITESGTYTLYETSGNFGTLTLQARDGGFDGSIDNVSVKEVGQNWSFGTGWSISGGKANANNVPNLQRLQQGLGTSVVGKKYKYSLNITNVSGFYSVYIFGVYVSATSNTEGVIKGEVIATSTNGAFWLAGASASGLVSATVDNISVIEITDDTDIPRIDYTSGQGALLLEPQSTNLVTYSEEFNNWIKTNTTIDSNVKVSPDGKTNASRINFSAIGSSFIRFISASGDPNGKSFTNSIYLKSDTANSVKIGILGSGGGLGYITETLALTNEWQRFDISQTFISSGDNVRFRLIATEVGSIFAWGGQSEELSYPTSYIVSNSGSATTRSADIANNSGNADLFNDSEGVLYAEIAALADDLTFRFISISDGTTANRVFIGYQNASNNFYVLAGTAVAFISHTITDITKIAVKYKSGDTSIFINGIEAAVKTDTYTLNGLNSLQFDSGGGGSDFYGKVKSVAVFKEALTDAELQKLTS